MKVVQMLTASSARFLMALGVGPNALQVLGAKESRVQAGRMTHVAFCSESREFALDQAPGLAFFKRQPLSTFGANGIALAFVIGRSLWQSRGGCFSCRVHSWKKRKNRPPAVHPLRDQACRSRTGQDLAEVNMADKWVPSRSSQLPPAFEAARPARSTRRACVALHGLGTSRTGRPALSSFCARSNGRFEDAVERSPPLRRRPKASMRDLAW